MSGSQKNQGRIRIKDGQGRGSQAHQSVLPSREDWVSGLTRQKQNLLVVGAHAVNLMRTLNARLEQLPLGEQKMLDWLEEHFVRPKPLDRLKANHKTVTNLDLTNLFASILYLKNHLEWLDLGAISKCDIERFQLETRKLVKFVPPDRYSSLWVPSIADRFEHRELDRKCIVKVSALRKER
jgi:hypothetical protein